MALSRAGGPGEEGRVAREDGLHDPSLGVVQGRAEVRRECCRGLRGLGEALEEGLEVRVALEVFFEIAVVFFVEG